MAKPKNQLKDRVASFRLPTHIDTEIEESIKGKIINVGCANKFYRKLALDWHAGRLEYKNPADFNADPDVLAAMSALPAQSPAPKG